MTHKLSALILVFGLFCATYASAANTDCDKESHYSEVSRDELASLVQQKAAFVIDVNSAESFKEHSVPGAIHYGSHEKDFAKVLPAQKDALIVAYCGGPQCTAWKKAAAAACNLGYTQILHFKGGISGWLKKS